MHEITTSLLRHPTRTLPGLRALASRIGTR